MPGFKTPTGTILWFDDDRFDAKFVPDNSIRISDEEYLEYIKPQDPLLNTDFDGFISDKVQSILDEFAKTKKYKNIESAISYETDPNLEYQKEALYCKQMRSIYWRQMTEIGSKLESGELRSITLEQVIELLPTLIWPT